MVRPFTVERDPRIDRLTRPFQEFARLEAAGGIVLLACTAVALVWANSAWAQSYYDFWHLPLTIRIGTFELSETLAHWINDGLMVVFFFVVGLEIKRELLEGELSSPSKAALPVAAAVGGMVGPALIYTAMNWGTDGIRGWAIPMATDIAFALGILALLGRRVPVTLKVFLAAAAIVDDLCAVLVIAFFYTDQISGRALLAGGMFLILLVIANLLGVRRPTVYLVLGVGLWIAVLLSGVHATIAGVLLAMTVPTRYGIDAKQLLGTLTKSAAEIKDVADSDSPEAIGRVHGSVHALKEACQRAEPPLLRFEHALTPWVAFVIMPVFALANAGLDLSVFSEAFTSRIGLGIALGLILGKAVGVTGFTWLTARMGIGALPDGVRWPHIWGLGLLAGIGFTMALFIAGLAFEEPALLDVSKSGIMLGSLVSGVLGFVLLRSIGGPSRA